MKIYTKTGDSGETGLFGGPRLSKDALRLEAVGTVDELNAVLGLVRAESPSQPLDSLLAKLQNELFEVGAELATLDPQSRGTRTIGPQHVETLEQVIDSYQGKLPSLDQFILPGGPRAAAALHLARTVCRRAERRVVTLARSGPEPISPLLVVYLNRLGDLLFVLARAVNAETGRPDVPWERTGGGG